MAEQKAGYDKRDLELFENEYAYMQDVTKGNIKVYNGPCIVNPAAQEAPVKYNKNSKRFERCNTMEDAKEIKPFTVEGFYCVLLNPSKDRKHPGDDGASNVLDLGHKINIPGPEMFALWPGQQADVVRGHHLRSNQYLLIRVYNEEEAKKNWSKAVIKAAAQVIDTAGMSPAEAKKAQEDADAKAKAQNIKASPPPDLVVGKLLTIKGTEVSFYIPPTGITVVKDEEVSNTSKATYVREALTLERLEYAILVDENGGKRYAYGPMVVFPNPTERFREAKNDDGQMSRKFRAIELNELQGIHIKVIADYEDKPAEEQTKVDNKRSSAGPRKYKAGEELFITGKDTAIYYPREEHSAVKYDGKTKSFATAVPVGEGRYVMNRMSGEIKTVKGPAMLLPDPRTEVITQRVLTDKQCGLWYPGNAEALEFNQKLRPIQASLPSTRAAPSPGDLSRGMKGLAQREQLLSANVAAVFADNSQVSKEQGFVGDEFSRTANFSAPRTLTLNTKYQGVPMVDVWTGFAIMVVSKNGNRRVELGPKTVLLEYDESLEVLELSTGKPKTTDVLQRTVYLRVENNQITDIIRAETSDHVTVEMKLSYRVNFRGEATKWFSVDNYIKYLCDHERSVVKGNLKKTRIEDFYANSTDLLKEMILGSGQKGEDKSSSKSYKGSIFPNGMEITDVEVLGVVITDDRIRALLDASQTDVVKSTIEVAQLKRGLEVVKQKELVSREEAEVRAATTTIKNQLDTQLAASALAVTLAKLGNTIKELEEKQKAEEEVQAITTFSFDANLSREKKMQEQRLAVLKSEQDQKVAFLKAEAETIVSKFEAVEGNFSEALLALSNNETMTKVAEAWNIQRAIGGDSVSDALAKVFANTPLSGLVKKMTNGASQDRLTAQV